jgi:hypothetical protein
MCRQKAIETLQHARVVVDDNYGWHPIADLMNPPVTLPINSKPSFAICEQITPLEWLRPGPVCDAVINSWGEDASVLKETLLLREGEICGHPLMPADQRVLD